MEYRSIVVEAAAEKLFYATYLALSKQSKGKKMLIPSDAFKTFRVELRISYCIG